MALTGTHALGDPNKLADDNLRDNTINANTAAIAGIPAATDVKIAAQHTSDNATYAPVAAANIFTANQTAPSLQLTTDAQAMQLSDTLGTSGRRIHLGPVNPGTSTASAQLELVPGDLNDPATSIPTQILLYNQGGTNYERFALTLVNDQYIIESNYNGTGTAKNINIQMGGSVSNSVAGQNAAVFYNDASVDLLGGTFTKDGKTWGSLRTRIADPGNSGDSRLIIDTRTGTPTSVATDTALINFRRGGTETWQIGTNVDGYNHDNFVFFSRGSVTNLLVLDGGATPGIGFFNTAPIAKRATTANATDLATVITLANALSADLVAYGLKS